MRPTLLVLASTYPRWKDDHEPGFTHELARRLTDDFHVIALVPAAPGAATIEILDGVEVIRYRYAPTRFETLVNDGGILTNVRSHRWKLLLVPFFIGAQTWQAWRLLRTRRVDAIHAHWLLPQGLIVALLGKVLRQAPPYLVTSHGADLYALRAHWLALLKLAVVRCAAAVTVVSKAMKKELVRIGADSCKVQVVPMGVDLTERFTPDPSVSRSRCEVLFVGRLVEKKGLRYLIDAMPSVLAAFPQAFLTIAGFGPEEHALRLQVRRLGLESCVHFCGAVAQEDLPLLYRRAAVFVGPFVPALSGDQEGLGLVTVEALGCGCPVVVSELPATSDVMMHGPGCLHVPPGDSGAIAQAIMDVLGHGDVHQRGAVACREQLVQRFDWMAVRSAYGKVLNDCIHAECQVGNRA